MKITLLTMLTMLATTPLLAQSPRIVVVPVDSATTARLVRLKAEMDSATKAYDKAVEEAKRELLTTRDKLKGDCEAYREGTDGEGGLTFSTLAGVSSGMVLTSNGWVSEHCATAEEKAADKKRQDEEKVKQAKWESEHPLRYWLKGFCQGAEFTEDYKYLVPKAPEPVKQAPWMYGINPASSGAWDTLLKEN